VSLDRGSKPKQSSPNDRADDDDDRNDDDDDDDDDDSNPMPIPLPTRSSPNSNKITLSGLLNFTDGLWSGCAEERIFIFTTNFKERLDPALLRPGRMDMHILLSYCSGAVALQLARAYLDDQTSPESHPELFQKLQDAADARFHTVSPAAVAEIFMSHRAAAGTGRPEAALEAAIQAFEKSADEFAANASANSARQEPSPSSKC
jgi:SpoVK/Ycf46/Vps4 family AAA+-type ATPase